MNDSAIFQGLTRAWSTGTPPMAWPMAFWKNCFFDCPVEVASHIQRFAGRQMQDQVQLFSELSKEENMANAFTKEAAFIQQSALAWSSEMLEVAELVQSKVLSSTQVAPPDAQQPPAH